MDFFLKAFNKYYTKLAFWAIGFALIAGLVLSVLSWLEICVEHCSANQDYRIFGLPFALVGLVFFTLTIVLHFLSGRYKELSVWVGWMIVSSLGAELMFIAIQKYQIESWCPVCLSIALCVSIAALVMSAGYFKSLFSAIKKSNRGATMSVIKKGLASVSFFAIGFLLAFIGVTKPDFAQAAANEMKERLVFGNKSSAVEMYFITDWFCPACKKTDPLIEALYPAIQSKVAFYFIDYPIHTKSLNFSPYNLSFLVNGKPHYFEARRLLQKIAEENETPTDKEVIAASEKKGLDYKELSFIEVKAGTDYFESVATKYELSSTPTLIIVNPKTKKTTKLEGTEEITKEAVLKAIETTSQAS